MNCRIKIIIALLLAVLLANSAVLMRMTSQDATEQTIVENKQNWSGIRQKIDCKLYVGTAGGSGFFITSDKIITCKHLFKFSIFDSIIVDFDGRIYVVEPNDLWLSPAVDLAIIDLSDNNDLPEVYVDFAADYRIGDEIYTYCNAYDQGPLLFKGIVAGKRKRIEIIGDYPLFIAGICSFPGCSGAFVANQNDEIVGMILGSTRQSGFTICLPADIIKNQIEYYEILRKE